MYIQVGQHISNIKYTPTYSQPPPPFPPSPSQPLSPEDAMNVRLANLTSRDEWPAALAHVEENHEIYNAKSWGILIANLPKTKRGAEQLKNEPKFAFALGAFEEKADIFFKGAR